MPEKRKVDGLAWLSRCDRASLALRPSPNLTAIKALPRRILAKILSILAKISDTENFTFVRIRHKCLGMSTLRGCLKNCIFREEAWGEGQNGPYLEGKTINLCNREGRRPLGLCTFK
jgi:hypothetical protein